MYFMKYDDHQNQYTTFVFVYAYMLAYIDMFFT